MATQTGLNLPWSQSPEDRLCRDEAQFYWVQCSKAVVLDHVLFIFLLWLCDFYYGPFHVGSCLALCSVFSLLFSTVITSLGEERELVYVLLVLLVAYFARIKFCPFSLPLCVVCCLGLVFVALTGIFYEPFSENEHVQNPGILLKNFFGIERLHVHVQWVCIMYAKYWRDLMKALRRIDFTKYALSTIIY